MLGSAAEADDVLQETYVRWSEHEGEVDSPRAFLTTIVVRLSLDHLKSARSRRETYVGPWLPEPLVRSGRADADAGDAAAPDARVDLAESLSLAFLVLLERLSPLERAAFLLREVFDHSYEEIASVLGTSEAACRQLVVRGRAHVDENRPRFAATEEKKHELLRAFLGAAAQGDTSALGKLLAENVVAWSDGGGKAQAALRPIYGRDRVTRFILGVVKKASPTAVVEIAEVNGEPGVVLREGEKAVLVVTLGVSGDGIREIWIVANPDKLARVGTG
jgi:RNA polymerase sigma-70 factor, ECF subfamily